MLFRYNYLNDVTEKRIKDNSHCLIKKADYSLNGVMRAMDNHYYFS